MLLIAMLFLACSVAAAIFFFFFAGYDAASGLKYKTTAACLVLISLFIVVKLAAALGSKDQAAVLLSEQGITAFTTPVSKAVGLVAWTDIADIRLRQGLVSPSSPGSRRNLRSVSATGSSGMPLKRPGR
ncbi:hypothetical protein [Taibaiella helva]|uniref:hypothetical protein n=1 Tax=Taibaiella helva TaxID=2301235 RepID=UPI0018E4F38E|nr:hypothetical protein [Taibaiella helva]